MWCGSRIATGGRERGGEGDACAAPCISERNVVVGHRLHRRLVGRAMRATALHASAASAAASTAAAQQRDAVGFDLRGVSLVAVLVVPLTRLQLALDVDLLALGEVLLQAFGRLAPQHHTVPLGLFLPLIVAVV